MRKRDQDTTHAVRKDNDSHVLIAKDGKEGNGERGRIALQQSMEDIGQIVFSDTAALVFLIFITPADERKFLSSHP